jgi:hypothetical protein
VAAGNLVIKDVEKTDGGDYVCVAENMAGVKQSDVATLSVHGMYGTAVLRREYCMSYRGPGFSCRRMIWFLPNPLSCQ